MKFVILAVCLCAVVFGKPPGGPPTDADGNVLPPPTDADGNVILPPGKPTKEDIENLIELCEALEDKRDHDIDLAEACDKLAEFLADGPPSKRRKGRKGGDRPSPKTDEEGNTLPPPTKPTDDRPPEEVLVEYILKGLKGVCDDLDTLAEMMMDKDGDKRSWESVFTGLGELCVDLEATFMEELEKQQDEEDRSEGTDKEVLGQQMLEDLEDACETLKELVELGKDKRSWDSVFRGLFGVCKDMKDTKAAEMNNERRSEGTDKEALGQQLLEEIEDACKTLKELVELGKDKRSWDSVFRGLFKVCGDVKETKAAEMNNERRGRRPGPPPTDENGDILPPPTDADGNVIEPSKPTKEDIEDLIELCESLEKRDDDADLEEACNKLAKFLDNHGPPTTEASKRGKGRRPGPPPTDENGDILPPPTDADGNVIRPPKPTKEEIEDLIEQCEALADEDKKRGDFVVDEDFCFHLFAKLQEKADRPPKPTKESKRWFF